MMKKTLLATAVVATLTATAAQAATVFENDTLKVDSYGRINLGLVNLDGDSKIEDIAGSRFGFTVSNKINADLTAFARAEFRFNADERSTTDTLDDKRNTFVGLRGGFGKVTLGNFDSIYYSAVSSSTDVFQNNNHHRSIGGGGTNGRGDTISYETNNLSGLQLGVAAKHSPEVVTGGVVTAEETWNLQAYAQYKVSNDLTLALAFDQNSEDSRGNKRTTKPSAAADYDPIIGARATYKLNALTASLLVESAGDHTHLGLVGSYNYGSGAVYASVSQYDNGDDSGLDLAVGADYRFSSAFRVYGEFAQGNDDVSAIQVAGEGVSQITLGARFDW